MPIPDLHAPVSINLHRFSDAWGELLALINFRCQLLDLGAHNSRLSILIFLLDAHLR